jgi:hypothetical protein
MKNFKRHPPIKKTLKDIVNKQKVFVLRDKFIGKLKRNLSESKPIDYIGFEVRNTESFLQHNGFESYSFVDNFIAVISIILIAILSFAYTLNLVF